MLTTCINKLHQLRLMFNFFFLNNLFAVNNHEIIYICVKRRLLTLNKGLHFIGRRFNRASYFDDDSKTVTILYLAQVGLKCMCRDSDE